MSVLSLPDLQDLVVCQIFEAVCKGRANQRDAGMQEHRYSHFSYLVSPQLPHTHWDTCLLCK